MMDFEVSDWNADNHVQKLDEQLFSPKNQLTVSSLHTKQSKKINKKSKINLEGTQNRLSNGDELSAKNSLSNIRTLKRYKLKKLKENEKKEKVFKRNEIRILDDNKNSFKNGLSKKIKKNKDIVEHEEIESVEKKKKQDNNKQEDKESIVNKKRKKKKIEKEKEKNASLENDRKKVKSDISMVNSAGESEASVKKKRKKKKKNSNKKNKYKHLDEERARLKQSLCGSTDANTGSSSTGIGPSERKVKTPESKMGVTDNKKAKIKRLETKKQEAGITFKAIKQNIKSKKRKFETDVEMTPETKKLKMEVEKSEKCESQDSVKKNNKNKSLTPKNKKQTENSKVEAQQKNLKSVTSPFNHNKLHKHLQKGEQIAKSELQKNNKLELPEASEQKKTGKQKWAAMSLRDRMLEQLKSARFRFINEQLYTQTGSDADRLFKEDKEAFHVYHEGFQKQVDKWPTNPVDVIIKKIKSCPGSPVVGDFGCGDAKIARSVQNKVHSFDLVALNEHVTVCNIEKVPLKNNSLDIAVFCLSLMGTNLAEYLMEANRVLKKDGILMIAEVKSRIPKVGKFIRNIEKMGFEVSKMDSKNDMFIMIDFKKIGKGDDYLPEIELEPCFYKKR